MVQRVALAARRLPKRPSARLSGSLAMQLGPWTATDHQRRETMRVTYLAILSAAVMASACARQQGLNVMTMEAVCDTIPRPMAPGEHVGGALPAAVAAVAERGVVIGVVLEAGTKRVLQHSRVRLYRSRSDTGRVQVGKDAWTNASGGFVLAPQDPGTYALVINRINYSAHTRQVTLRAGVVDTVHAELLYRSCVGY